MADEKEAILTPTVTEVVEFGSFRSPESALKEAEMVAKAFKLRADRLALYKQIGASKHLLIEGWQTLAAIYRVTAGIVSDRYVEFGDAEGFEATAEAIYVPTGNRISTANAMCLNDEENWGFRPKYEYVDGKKEKVGDVAVPLQQLRSMAQTRACSKVLSNLLKWVARMAGFAGTPAEEMTGSERAEEGNGKGYQQPQRSGKVPQGPNDPISQPRINRLYAIAKSANKSEDEVGIAAAHHGYNDITKILCKDYDAICNLVAQPKD